MKILNVLRLLSCVSILFASVVARAGIANDQCASARYITEIGMPYQGSNAMANLTDDAEAACQPESGFDVWFRYVASCSGVVTIDTLGSEQSDTVLSVYSNCSATEIACNDDFDGGFLSKVDVDATVGNIFWIRLASVSDPGDFNLNISCLTAPANDTCASATTVADGHSAAIGNNYLADVANEGEAGCQEYSRNDVWFDYTASCIGKVIADTFGSVQSDTLLSVYNTCGGAQVACNDDALASLSSQVTFDGIMGQSYRIQLASVAEPGAYRLNIECIPIPANDACLSAVSINDGAMAASGNNTLASTSDDAEAGCQELSNNDIWFEYVASCNGLVIMNTLGSLQLDPILSVFDGCGATEIACNDDSNGKFQSELSFSATQDQSYRVRLASVGEPGDYILNVQCLSVPFNDVCTSATSVTNGTPAFSGNNFLANVTDDVESSCQTSDYDVWFSYESTCDGAVTVDTLGSHQYDTLLAVYDACSGNEIACGDDAKGTLHAEVSFATVIGQIYQIRLASVSEAGDYVLNIACLATPENESCATAKTVTDGVSTGNNLLASTADDAEASCQSDSNGDLWFQYTSSCAGMVTINTAGSAQDDTVVSVYDGCGGTELACNDDSNGSLRASVTFGTALSQTVLIRLASVGTPGEFSLNIECAATPTNETCTSALLVSDGAPAIVGTNLLASAIDDQEAECQEFSNGDVWFQYVASCTGVATIDTFGSGQSDTVLSAYSACGSAAIACNDDSESSLQSRVSFGVSAGSSYFVRLASAAEPGNYSVSVACLGVPVNDTCISATIIEAGVPAVNGNNMLAAIANDAEASCAFSSYGDVWFKFVAECSNSVQIDTMGSTQSDTILSVFGACGGTEIVCNDDAEGLLSSLAFDAVKGQTHWIRVASIGPPGEFVLNIEPSGTCRTFGDVNNDGTVNLDDILCELAAFTGNYNCAGGLTNADIFPCYGGNGVINLDDIMAVLQGFSGIDMCP